MFPSLRSHLGAEWANFITALPGWPLIKAKAVVDQSKECEINVPNRIQACLDKWNGECQAMVTKGNILKALKAVDRHDVIAELEEATSPPADQQGEEEPMAEEDEDDHDPHGLC